MNWVRLKRSKIKVFGKPAKIMMKGMTAPEEHTHFLHSLLTNNVKALGNGHFNYNLWLRQNGQPVGDFFIYRIADYFILDTEKSAGEVIKEFNKLKLSLKVYFEDLSDELEHIFIFGEGAEEFVKEVFGAFPKEFEFIQREDLIIANNPLRLKGPGYDLIGKVPLEVLPPDREVDEYTFEDLRIRRCVPRIGKELKEGFSPLEAGVLNYAIDMNKGCYVGQEAIARVYFRGRTPRVLVKLHRVDGELREGDKLIEGSKNVGLITSVTRDGTEALAYILRTNCEKGKSIKGEHGIAQVEELCD